MSSHTKFHVFSTIFVCYEMSTNKLEMVSNVVLTSLTATFFIYFPSFHFTCLFHSESFQKFNPTMLQVLQPLS